MGASVVMAGVLLYFLRTILIIYIQEMVLAMIKRF